MKIQVQHECDTEMGINGCSDARDAETTHGVCLPHLKRSYCIH